jgi:regulatory protein
MPVITRIAEQKRRANRRNVYLDGAFAFGCNLNVVAKFRLREGMSLTETQVEEILRGEVRQECFDKAMEALQSRLHSRAELHKKLTRREYGEAVINGVLDDLARLGYVDDERFAKNKALSAAQYKHHGRRRAMVELLKSGVKGETARKALDDVYDAGGAEGGVDSVATARMLAQKKAPSLRKLDPLVARRRLMGMLQRRGFDYDSIKPVVDEVLGDLRDSDEP